jgi:acyl CoA:acetate/3-ketoacid CoA transferase
MSKITTAAAAVAFIEDGATVAVNSSSGLCCPDAVLAALGERYAHEKSPRGLNMLHPIAAGDMFGTKGVDHLAAHAGMIDTIIGGSYPSGPSSAEPPADLADDQQERGRGLQRAVRHRLRHAARSCRQSGRACSPRSAWRPSSIPRA